MHILKYTEWESVSGWHSGDVSDLANGSNYWWLPARMLNISPVDYVILLKDRFNAKKFVYFKDKNVLLWKWENYNDCHKFTLWVNSESRKRKFFI